MSPSSCPLTQAPSNPTIISQSDLFKSLEKPPIAVPVVIIQIQLTSTTKGIGFKFRAAFFASILQFLEYI
jgi:hypothetical protein